MRWEVGRASWWQTERLARGLLRVGPLALGGTLENETGDSSQAVSPVQLRGIGRHRNFGSGRLTGALVRSHAESVPEANPYCLPILETFD